MVFDDLYERRDPAAAGGAVLVMIALWLSWHHLPAPAPKAALQDETVITMEELPPPPLPEPPPPPKPEPPRPPEPRPVVRPVQAQTPTPAPQTPVPSPTATPDPAPAPVQPAPQPPAPPPPAPAPRPAANANLESSYAGQLRAYVNSIKRYPNSREARQLRPTGTVKVWMEIDRQGQLLDAGVEQGADSPLLDKEALRTVRGGHYPSFPPDAFAGKSSHRFVIAIEYLLEGS
jgi:protein TonB